MTEPTYLITGATGATGGSAARILLERGRRVRALVHREDGRAEQLRKLGAEIALGDLLDFDSVRAATHGVQRAYFCFPIIPGIAQASAQFAQASKESGLEAVVNMSQVSARADARSVAARQHWLGERIFDWSGVGTTHLRPTFFMEWLMYVAPMIKQGVMFTPFSPTGRHAPIAAEDQGRVIAAILEEPAKHVGHTYPLFGSVEMTYPDMANIVGSVLSKPIKYEQVPTAKFGEMLLQGRAREPNASDAATGDAAASARRGYLMQHLQEVAVDHANGIFAGTNDLVAEIGGRTPISVAEYVSNHRAAFQD